MELAFPFVPCPLREFLRPKTWWESFFSVPGFVFGAAATGCSIPTLVWWAWSVGTLLTAWGLFGLGFLLGRWSSWRSSATETPASRGLPSLRRAATSPALSQPSGLESPSERAFVTPTRRASSVTELLEHEARAVRLRPLRRGGGALA